MFNDHMTRVMCPPPLTAPLPAAGAMGQHAMTRDDTRVRAWGGERPRVCDVMGCHTCAGKGLKMGGKGQNRGKRGKKWAKLGKTGGNWGKMCKNKGKLRKPGKSGQKWEEMGKKLGKVKEKWGKIGKNGKT